METRTKKKLLYNIDTDVSHTCIKEDETGLG